MDFMNLETLGLYLTGRPTFLRTFGQLRLLELWFWSTAQRFCSTVGRGCSELAFWGPKNSLTILFEDSSNVRLGGFFEVVSLLRCSPVISKLVGICREIFSLSCWRAQQVSLRQRGQTGQCRPCWSHQRPGGWMNFCLTH